MAHFVAGHHVLKKITEALGLQNQGVTRVVIDIKIKDVVKVYVERMVNDKSLLDVVDILAQEEKSEPETKEGTVDVQTADGFVSVMCDESNGYEEKAKV